MDRGSSVAPLSWLILPAAGILLASALSLPQQAYTGLTLRGDEVMAVVPGGPGERAGVAPGDRLASVDRRRNHLQGPLAAARPGAPLVLALDRGEKVTTIRLLPLALPGSERRMLVALFAVASGFVLLGGWVWSERRDRLTRPFYLLCLAFGVLMAPPPRLSWPASEPLHDLLYTAATLFLPALCVHFFALFPEPPAPRGRVAAGTLAAYAVAGSLCVAWGAAFGANLAGFDTSGPVLSVLQAAAAIWFASGLLWAVALFARSYLRAGGVDARRRLRVALAGTALGLGPLAALTVWRNLAPGSAVPGERVAVVLTLLVPLSFTWASVIHRIFDFGVAVKAAVVAAILALTAGAIYVAGELATLASPDAGVDFGAVSLALVGLAASLAGPARPWARAIGRAVLPLRDARPLSETLSLDVLTGGSNRHGLLEQVTAALASQLRLDRCLALESDGPERCRMWGPSGEIAGPARPCPAAIQALAGRTGPVAIDDLPLASSDREALLSLGAHWLLPIDARPQVAVLLGRRLAGPWLDRHEVEMLSRFARHASLALENVALRHAARSHGEIDRELALAGAIQSHLLPRRAPIYPTLDCAAATLSSEAVGGDYYDFVERSSRDLTLVVGDAAGKGVPAALRLAGVQARFRDEALRGQDPGPLLQSLNQELVHHQHPENFVGLLCARVDVRAARVRLANAGLEPPLLRRGSGAWEILSTSGLLLGVRSDAEYLDSRVELRAGDLVLIYTDGLTEARRGEELFGTARVQEVMDANAHRRASGLVEALIQAARSFADHPLDDLTVVVLKQLADPPATPAPLRRGKRPSSPAGWNPILLGEATDAVSPVREANPRAADPTG